MAFAKHRAGQTLLRAERIDVHSIHESSMLAAMIDAQASMWHPLVHHLFGPRARNACMLLAEHLRLPRALQTKARAALSTARVLLTPAAARRSRSHHCSSTFAEALCARVIRT